MPVFKRVTPSKLSAGVPYLFRYVGSSTRATRTLDLTPTDSLTVNPSTMLKFDNVSDLVFAGTFKDMSNDYAVENGAYILQTDDTWSVPEESGSETCLEAYHAYLLYKDHSTPVSTITMTLSDVKHGGKVDPDDPTAIDGVILEEEDGSRAWYDLQGHRLDGPQKGLNILRTEDGKTRKVVKKN